MAWFNDHPGPIYAVLTDDRRALHIAENPLLRRRSKNWRGLVELNDADRRKEKHERP
jgi:hypothetical protein